MINRCLEKVERNDQKITIGYQWDIQSIMIVDAKFDKNGTIIKTNFKVLLLLSISE
jgi:hypothetical protein